ncbi:MAG: hypothetical protein ABS46_03820 [Cytophagaceae bacterium SCN 52-12]|nr:MAG: hypothetical protein ABS46_03820 [Cytophagaceae bacterium SCN 52-12]
MKKKLINQKYLAGLLTLTVFFASCSEDALDGVNRDRNNTADVSAKFILTDLMTSTAFSVAGGDISLYSSVYVEHETGVHNQTYNAEIRSGEPTLATTNNNSWNAIYQNIKNAKIAIAKTSAGGPEEGNDVTNGIAKVLLAYNLGVLTDFFGDAPFSETGIMNEDGTPKYYQPKIEKQSELYPQIQQFLDEAIASLAGTDAGVTGGIGTQDLIYGGAKAQWIKAAYGLKARYLMHTLKVSSNANADLATILSYIDKSFTSVSDEMKFDRYDGVQAVNPLFGYTNARDGLGASKSLLTKFTEYEDPRGEPAFGVWGSQAVVHISLADALEEAAPNGAPEQVQYFYPLCFANYAYGAPTMLLSYHELMFLKAEALARLQRTEEAEEALQGAVVAAFANFERSLEYGIEYVAQVAPEVLDLSEEVALDYFENSVKARFTENPLKEIMVQKYLGFYGASGESTEAFNDIRRMKALGEDFITLANPKNVSQFPLRFPYGNSDVTTNQHIFDAYGNGSYVYTENVWWAGGTR